MDKLYIPGDLVMTNGVSGGTAKDVIYRVTSSDPSRIFVLDDGTVLKGIVRLENLKDVKLEDEGYLYYGSSYVYFKDIIPIPLTTEILEKNGWEHNDDIYFKEFPHRKLVIMDESAYIINECCSMFLCQAKFVHELQHLLFGLDISHEMKV